MVIYNVLLRIIIKVLYKLKIFDIFCNYLEDYADKYTNNILRKYMDESLSLLSKDKINDKYNEQKKNSEIIWVFWWQGEKHMPPIVKLCIKSIKKNSGNYKVIIINKYNVKYYTNIPKYIYEKFYKGYIDLTHFSDLLRFNLLNNYGGLWIDSTVYCTSKINKNYFNYLYTSGGYHNTDPKFVAGRWTSFLIGGNKNNQLFQFMNNYFNIYWKYNNHQLDYFMMDYALNYGYDHNIGNFKDYVDRCAKYNNPHLFNLVDKLNDVYDDNIYKKITRDTNMFKLTYKKIYNLDNNTFYTKMMHKYF